MKKILLMVAMLNVCIAYGDLIYDDNQEHVIDFYVDIVIDGRVYVENSTIVNVVDGAHLGMSLLDNSTAYISGGEIWNIVGGGQANAYISGGDFTDGGDFYFTGDSVAHIMGGLWSEEFLFQDNSSVIFYGTDFTHTIDGLGYYQINGTLQSGDMLNNFRVKIYPDASIQFVPEPCTLAMLALGGVLIRRRRAA